MVEGLSEELGVPEDLRALRAGGKVTHLSGEGMSKLRDLSPHASPSFLQEKARRNRSVLGQRRPKLDYEEGPSALVGVGKA